MSNTELMALDEDDLPDWIPPPPLTGVPMSNAELMALRDEDLPCEVKPIVDSVEQRRAPWSTPASSCAATSRPGRA